MAKQISDPDETRNLLERVCTMLPGVKTEEKRMFGGVTLMLNGNMLCCASKKGLMIRVGKEAESEALRLPHARPCDGAGHKMPGFIMIDHEGLRKDRDLAAGVEMALRHVTALPPKEPSVKATSRRPKLVTHRP
ncbi:MAG: TfoX/Sxy family protein [Nitrosomonadales bacterium]|nr:TfoX/Sxy family protein [Nitrosomonadales bacterium]